MFNSTTQSNMTRVSNNNNLHINAITGTILKNHPLSWIESFHLNGERAKELFSNQAIMGKRLSKEIRGTREPSPQEIRLSLCKPHSVIDYEYEEYEEKPHTIILQMTMCGDKEVIAELVRKEDYEVVDNG